MCIRDSDNPLQALYKYRVRTLHGLAHDIVREKPARVGLEERFSIIDEREAGFIRKESVNAWLASHSLDEYLDPALDQSKLDCCLLYTSDAADERSSVDLGGRRII